jgi:hypothetical protein
MSRQRLRHASSDHTVRPTPQEANSPEGVASATDMHEEERQQETPPTSNSSSQTSLSNSSELLRPTAGPQQSPSTEAWPGPFFQATSNMPQLSSMKVDANDGNLALQLNTMYQRILACKEAMWEELRRRVLLRRSGGQDLLQGLAWDETKETDGDSSDSGHGHGNMTGNGYGERPPRTEAQELERARERFEELVLRFEEDLRHRAALTDAVETALGWSKPPPPPKSKYERAREAELARAIAEAEREEAEQGPPLPQLSRSLKYFVGFKDGKR